MVNFKWQSNDPRTEYTGATFNQGSVALERFHTLYNDSEYNWVKQQVSHFQPKEALTIMILISDVTCGLCDFPYYVRHLTYNITWLFYLIKSPVLYEIVLAYINRFK